MRRFTVFAIFLTLASAASCGVIGLGGGGSSLNEAAPAGSILKQGSFTGSVSGTAAVYVSLDGTMYTLRLQIFSISSSESSFFITLYGFNGNFSTQLRALTGSQNYVITNAASLSGFNQVSILSYTQTPAQIGTAPLTQ